MLDTFVLGEKRSQTTRTTNCRHTQKDIKFSVIGHARDQNKDPADFSNALWARQLKHTHSQLGDLYSEHCAKHPQGRSHTNAIIVTGVLPCSR